LGDYLRRDSRRNRISPVVERRRGGINTANRGIRVYSDDGRNIDGTVYGIVGSIIFSNEKDNARIVHRFHASSDTGCAGYVQHAVGRNDPNHAGIRALEMGARDVAKLTVRTVVNRQSLEAIDKIRHSPRVTRARKRAKLV